MTQEFFDLVKDYKERHPKAQDPFDFLNEFGDDALVKIIKEANGRKINFDPDPNNKQQTLDASHSVSYG
jgi:hypothetical protein